MRVAGGDHAAARRGLLEHQHMAWTQSPAKIPVTSGIQITEKQSATNRLANARLRSDVVDLVRPDGLNDPAECWAMNHVAI